MCVCVFVYMFMHIYPCMYVYIHLSISIYMSVGGGRMAAWLPRVLQQQRHLAAFALRPHGCTSMSWEVFLKMDVVRIIT